MNWTPYLPLLSGGVTPELALQSVALRLGWALVLGAIAAFLLRPFPTTLRLATIVLVMLVSLMPGEWSPSWWLGLAFQTPSLTLQGIGLLYLMRMWRLKNLPPVETLSSTAHGRWPTSVLLLASLIGWIFALDTFAAFGIHLYAIGFTPYAVLVTLLLAALLQFRSLLSGHPPAMQRHRELAAIILVAMAIHLLTRLPTGNVWDALMDPWLWMFAQTILVARVVKWMALLVRIRFRQAGERVVTNVGKAR